MVVERAFKWGSGGRWFKSASGGRVQSSPPEKLLEWSKENIQTVPESEGVYQLRDADKQILSIKGVMNMKDSLLEEFEENDKVA